MAVSVVNRNNTRERERVKRCSVLTNGFSIFNKKTAAEGPRINRELSLTSWPPDYLYTPLSHLLIQILILSLTLCPSFPHFIFLDSLHHKSCPSLTYSLTQLPLPPSHLHSFTSFLAQSFTLPHSLTPSLTTIPFSIFFIFPRTLPSLPSILCYFP